MAPLTARDGCASNEIDSHISFIGASLGGGALVGFILASALFNWFSSLDGRLRWQLESAKTELAEQKQAVATVRNDKEHLEAQLREAHAQNITADGLLRNKCADAERENGELTHNLTNAEQRIRSLQDQEAALVQRLAIRSSELAELRERVETQGTAISLLPRLESELEQLRPRLAQAEQRATDRSERIKHLNTRIAELDKEVSEKRDALKESKSRLQTVMQIIAEEDDEKSKSWLGSKQRT